MVDGGVVEIVRRFAMTPEIGITHITKHQGACYIGIPHHPTYPDKTGVHIIFGVAEQKFEGIKPGDIGAVIKRIEEISEQGQYDKGTSVWTYEARRQQYLSQQIFTSTYPSSPSTHPEISL